MGRGAAPCEAPPHVRALRTALGAGFRIRLRRKVPYVFSQKNLPVFACFCTRVQKFRKRKGEGGPSPDPGYSLLPDWYSATLLWKRAESKRGLSFLKQEHRLIINWKVSCALDVPTAFAIAS